MRAGHVLLISAVVHAGLAAVLSQIVLEGKRVARSSPPEPEPIEIAIVDTTVAPMPPAPAPPAPALAPTTVAPAIGRTIHATKDRRPGPPSPSVSASIATTSSNGPSIETSNGASDATTPTSDNTTSGHGYMRMRGAELGLDPEVAERIAQGGGHELPEETKPSGIMQHVSGGKAVIYDRVTTVSVEQDGTAHFADKPDIDIHVKLPIPHIDIEGMRKDLGEQLTKWYADPDAGKRYGRSQELSNINLAVPGACDDWGSIWCDDPLAPDAEKYAREQKKTNGSLLGGPADITAYLHRKFVGDPYASRKKKLLDDTRDERAKMGSEFRAQQLGRSAELVARNLARLAAAQLPAIEKRAALFELWDECAEVPGTTSGSDGEVPAEDEAAEVGQAGQRARAQVLGWIRSHLPESSPDAYSDEEIVRLNLHRSSKQRFEPYENRAK